jgi:hypothetical protein
MLKRIALLGLAASIVLTPAVALAQTGASYGSQGSYGAPGSLTPFDRSQNHFNESKDRARAGAAWIRHHGGVSHTQPMAAQ